MRDTTLSRHLYAEKSIQALANCGDLLHFSDHVEVSVEAVKCLVNFAIRAMEIEKANGNDTTDSLVLKVLREADYGHSTVVCLKHVASQSLESEEVFALCRLLNMELWDPHLKHQVESVELVDLLLRLLQHNVTALDNSKGSSPQDVHRFNIAGDVMRMFFQLSSEFGPLSQKAAKSAAAYPITSESNVFEEQLRRDVPFPPHVAHLFEQSIELLKRALLFDYRDARMSQLQIACVTYAINLPKEQILKFDAFVVLPYLMDILIYHMELGQDEGYIASLLMLFTKIARDEPRTRAIFMQRLFPNWKAVFENPSHEPVRMPKQHEGTPGKLIIDYMQASNTGLHFYANEFVFLLCNENAGAFTTFVGFGPAAGHLAIRGLMNVGGKAEGTSDAEPVKVTNWQERKIANPDMSHMSEEDVREWNDLCEKMDRLDELGVIKMVTPGNSNNNTKHEDESKKK